MIFIRFINYLISDLYKIDVIIGAFGITDKRNQILDYPYPASKTALQLVIPKPLPEKKNYIYAICEPFQPQVN